MVPRAVRADGLALVATRRHPRRRLLVALIAIGAVVILALLVTHAWIQRYVSAERIQRKLEENLDGYTVAIDKSEFSVFKRSFLATGIHIIPDTVVIEQRHRLGKGVNT